MPMISFLRRRTNVERAADLDQMAAILHKRSSTNPFDQLHVSHMGGLFRVEREGQPEVAAKQFSVYREAADYIRRFYRSVLLDGSGAPDDIFLDSLSLITKKRPKSHHKRLTDDGAARLAGWTGEDLPPAA